MGKFSKFKWAMPAMLLMVFGTNVAMAQEAEKVEVSIGGDVVSGYIWRGLDCGGVSIQPSISVSRSGFSLTAWGSVGLESRDTKEIDLTLGYEVGGFNIAITDYWLDSSHTFEATLGYDFGPLALSWNSYFAGDDYTKVNGKRAYSSYFEAVVPFRLGGFNFAAEVGATPWEGAYSTGFNVVNISLGAGKEIKISEAFSLPLFVKLTFNPNQEKAFFVFGLSF